MHDLHELIDVFDRVVAMAADVVAEDCVLSAAGVGREARSRRGYLGETVVVALVGGTGSGKSSIVNALAGLLVAETGPMRPTTSRPLALIPSNPESGLVRLLEDLGIERRVGQDRDPWLAVLDLPDTDSVVSEHQLIVDSLLPRVDAVVWVADPEKYQDRVLHAAYIANRVGYQAQFVFVLNQIDRLSDEGLSDLLEDFEASLRSEGIIEPVIVAMAADPDAGLPVGIDGLVEALRSLGRTKEVVTRKLIVDMDEAVSRVGYSAGLSGGQSSGFSGRWSKAMDQARGVVETRLVRPALEERALAAGAAAGRSAVGLLPGRPTSIDWVQDDRLRPVAEVSRVLSGCVTDTADLLAPTHGAVLRLLSDGIDHQVDAAFAALALSARSIEAPRWLTALAWVRRLALVGGVVAPVWLLEAWKQEQSVLVPLLAFLCSVLLLAVGRFVGAAGGARRARRSVDAQVDAICSGFVTEVDRRVGMPIRMELRRRAGLVNAMAEYAIARERFRVNG